MSSSPPAGGQDGGAGSCRGSGTGAAGGSGAGGGSRVSGEAAGRATWTKVDCAMVDVARLANFQAADHVGVATQARCSRVVPSSPQAFPTSLCAVSSTRRLPARATSGSG